MTSVQGEPPPLIRERSANSLKKTTSRSSSDSATKEKVANVTVLQKNDDEDTAPGFFDKIRPYLLIELALLILGWWISATVLQATRHRW